jgi:hypothetical protein
MFSGEAETSTAGLGDILLTLQGILRHCLPQRTGSGADSRLPPACIVYNDAAAMQAHLQDPATDAAVRQAFQDVQ